MAENSVKIVSIDTIRKRSKKQTQKPPTESPIFGKGLTDQVMRELKERFSLTMTEEDYRNKAIFLLMSKTGLRAKETVSLRFSGIFKAPSGENLIQYVRKGGKKGYSVLSEEIITAVKAYHNAANIISDHFFLSRPKRHQKTRTPLTTRSLQRIVNSWNVVTCTGKTAHPHSIRHTVGQKLLEKAGSIAAQKVLGHSTPITTSKFYTKPYFDGSSYLEW
ncbi:tyrosine-type recombinase/integrase [Leptospira wolffii]|uniref:tyrosine-type recombinase/integrase n=1 Tax=Leptospira wolffii TaxID=409998 RepID=UPI00058EBEEE|nr:tyrosine-type recombinase/integrase [Leptospira wolffii]